MVDNNQEKKPSIKNYYLSLKLDPRAYDYNSLIQKLIDILNGRDLGNLGELEWSQQRRLINDFMLTLENYGGKENYDKALMKEYGILLPVDLSKNEEFTDFRELDFEQVDPASAVKVIKSEEPLIDVDGDKYPKYEFEKIEPEKVEDPEKELEEFFTNVASETKGENITETIESKFEIPQDLKEEVNLIINSVESELDSGTISDEKEIKLPEKMEGELIFPEDLDANKGLNLSSLSGKSFYKLPKEKDVDLNLTTSEDWKKEQETNEKLKLPKEIKGKLIFPEDLEKGIIIPQVQDTTEEVATETHSEEPNLFEELMMNYHGISKEEMESAQKSSKEVTFDGDLNKYLDELALAVEMDEKREQRKKEAKEEQSLSEDTVEVKEENIISNDEELNDYLTNLSEDMKKEEKQKSKLNNLKITKKWKLENIEFQKGKLKANLKFFSTKAGKVILVTSVAALGTILVAVGVNNAKETTTITAYKGETLNQVMDVYDISRSNIKNEPSNGNETFMSNREFEVTKYFDAEDKIAEINQIDDERKEEYEKANPKLYSFYYTVQFGDTWSGLVERFSAKDIKKDEPGKDLYYGEDLVIWTDKKGLADEMNSRYEKQMAESMPSDFTTYVVKDGDTLAAIANAHHANILDIMEYNEIADPDCISTGNVIKIPVYEKTNSHTK